MASGLLGRLSVIVTADTRQLVTGLQSAAGETKNFNRSMNQILTTLGARFVGVFASAAFAVGELGREIGSVGAEFEQAVTVLGAIQGEKLFDFAPNADFNEAIAPLANAARELGAATTFTATEAAEAMQNLARAGLGTSEIIGTVGAALNFAGANATTLEKSTALLAATMAQFNLTSRDSVRITDTFTVALQNSLLDVRSLTVAMRYAGTIGASLGMSLEQTTAAIAMFRDLGLEGSTAGTQFRQAMLALTSPTQKARDTLERLNLSVKDINPAIHGFAKVIKTLGENNLTIGEITELVSKRAAGSIAQMALAFEAGNAKYESLLKKFQTEVGVTEKTYKRSVDNVFSGLKLVRSAAEDLAIGVFQIFADDAKDFLVSLRDAINGVKDSFTSMAPVIQRSLDRIRIAFSTISPEEREEALVTLTTAFVRLIEISASFAIALVKNFNNIKNAIKLATLALMTFAGAIAGGIGLNALKLSFAATTKSIKLLAGTVFVLKTRFVILKTAIAALPAAIATASATFTTLFTFLRAGPVQISRFAAGVTSLRAALIVLKGEIAATGLAATLALPGFRELAIIFGALAAAKVGYDKLFGDDSDLARTKETVRLFGVAATNVRDLQRTQAGTNEELEKAANNTAIYSRNLSIRLQEEGKLNDLIKTELDFLQELDAAQVRDLFNKGQLIKVVDQFTGQTTLLTTGLATQLAMFDDNETAVNEFLTTISELDEKVESLTDSALHLDSVRTGFENIRNVSDEARAVFGELDRSLQGLSKEQLRNALASMNQVDRLNLLDAAKKQLIDTAGLLSTRSRALASSIQSADGQIKKFIVSTRLAKLENERLQKELADEAATKEYINKLKNARAALEKFRATLEEALVKARGEKRTAQAMKQIRRLNELNQKLENLEKASFERRLEREQDYFNDVAKIQETEELKIISDRKKLMTKMINETKKIDRNAVSDLIEVNRMRLDEIDKHETDQLELLEKSNKAKLDSLKRQRELEQAASLKRLKTRSAERKAEAEINANFDDKELKVNSDFLAKKKQIEESSEKLRQQSAELNNRQMLEIENEAMKEILELRAQAEESDRSPLIRLRAEQKLQKEIFAEKLKGHIKAQQLNEMFNKALLDVQKELEKDIIQSNILIADSFTGVLLGLQAGQIGGASIFGQLASDVTSLNDLLRELENIADQTREFSKETEGLSEEQKKTVDQNLRYLGSLRAVVGFLAKSQSATQLLTLAVAGLGAAFVKLSTPSVIKGLKNISEFIDPSEVDETSSFFGDLKDQLGGVLDAIVSLGPPIRDFFTKDGFIEDMKSVGEFFKSLGGSIKTGAVDFVDVIKDIPGAFSDAKTSIGDFFDDLASGSEAGISAFKAAAESGASSSESLAAGLKGFFGAAGGAGTALIATLGVLLAAIAAIVAAVAGAISLGKKIPGIIMQVTNKFNDLFTTITGGETLNIFDVLKNGVNEVVRSMDNSTERVAQLRQQLEDGRITAEEFNEAMANLEGSAGREAAAELFVDNLVARSKAFITAFGAVGSIIITRFTAAIPELFSLIRTNGAALLNNLVVNVPAFIGTVISSASPLVIGLINTLADAIPGLISRLVSLLTGALPQFFTAVQSALGNIFQSIISAIPQLVAGIKAALPGLLDNIRLFNTAIAEILAAVVPLFVRDILPELISSTLKTFTAQARAFITGVGTLIRAFVPQLIPIFSEVLTALVPLIAPLIGLISDLLVATLDLSGKFTPQIIELAAAFVIAIIDHLPEIVSVLLLKVVPEISKALAMALVDATLGGVGALVRAITDIFLKVFGPIIRIFDGDFDISGPGEAIGQFVGDVVGAIESGVDTVVGFFTGIGDAVGGFLTPFFNDTPGAIMAGSNGLTASFAAGDYVAAAQEPMELLRQALAANTGALSAMMGGVGSAQPIDIAIMAEGRLLDAVQVRALDRGHAPKMERRIRRSGGANIGFNRGRFNKYGA